MKKVIKRFYFWKNCSIIVLYSITFPLMLKSEITKWGTEILKTVFAGVLKSDDKEVWKKAISFMDSKIQQLEATTRGEDMFFWRNAKFQMLNKFGKKFIKKPTL